MLAAYQLTAHTVTAVTANAVGRPAKRLFRIFGDAWSQGSNAADSNSKREETTGITVPFVSDMSDTLRAAHENMKKFQKILRNLLKQKNAIMTVR